MTAYLSGVVLLNFLVDFLLLMGADRLCGYPNRWGRSAVAAALGGVYAGACLLPQVHFLGNVLWRMVFLALMAWISYGFSGSALRRGVVFVLLSMALGGVAMTIGKGGVMSILMAAAVLFVMCAVGLRSRVGSSGYVYVELNYGDKRMKLTALQDTGNTLRDPITGRPVLVVDADTAQRLTGLSRQQLRCPVEVMARPPFPGLRLIPYRSVGQPGGLLLGIRLQQVRIGNWSGSSLVAFAPDGLSGDGAYQALTGGAL